MKIAIASGKGGTGKTTIATNLAVSISQAGRPVQYLDCDVEEPNGHIFLKPHIDYVEDVTVGVPQVDESKCTGCGRCGQLCQYSAIICIQKHVLTFEQLCHSCGGCMAVCPTFAIAEKQRKIGVAEFGAVDGVAFGHGKLDIGAIQTPALIRQVKRNARKDAVVILDAPPGTSCPVIEAVKGTDFVLLVTEPTPFGLNDLELAVGMVRALKLPFAVIINRCDMGDDGVVQYCRREGIDVAMEIPNDRKIAEAYSRGQMVVDVMPEYTAEFRRLYERIRERTVAP
ncbi:MAG: (4Fe-4S)-binding protein [Planctomycetes bacterium RBG_13_60_9]|nr:MAG: (4Fe-4S)-binding protein [Planctomycetes bacterium RBG_13_60_9]